MLSAQQGITNATVLCKVIVATMYMNLYPWFCMHATVHTILVYSPDIIKPCILHVGQVSEELQEAHSNDYRRFREGHTRTNIRNCHL